MSTTAAVPETSPRRGGNAIALLINQLTRILAGLGISVLLGRFGGPTMLGWQALLSTLSRTTLPVMTLQSTQLISREVARAPEQAGTMRAIGYRFPLLALPLVALAVPAYLLWIEAPTAVLWCGMMLVVSQILRGFLSSEEGTAVGLRIAPLLVRGYVMRSLIIIALTAWWIDDSLMGLVGFFGASVIGDLVGWRVVRRTLSPLVPPHPPIRWSQVTAMLPAGFTFATMGVLGTLFNTFDNLMLERMKGAAELGLYTMPQLLLFYLAGMIHMVNSAFLPRLAALRDDPEQAAAEVATNVRVLSCAGVPVSVGGLMIGGPLLTSVMGPDFAAGEAVAAAVFVMMAPRVVSNTLSAGIIAWGREKARSGVLAAMVVLNVVLNLVLIPEQGALGAAVASLTCETGLVVGYFVIARKDVPGVRILRPMLPALAAAIPMAAVLHLTAGWNPWAQLPLAGATYFLASRLTGGWNLDALRRLRRI